MCQVLKVGHATIFQVIHKTYLTIKLAVKYSVINTVIPLFSTPLYQSSVPIDQSLMADVDWIDGDCTTRSQDHQILNGAKWTSLKKEVEKHVSYFFYEIMCADKKTEIYITESWCNKTLELQKHQRHNHSNSLFSGVIYFNNSDNAIVFHNSRYNMLSYPIEHSTPMNSNFWALKPRCGMILIFPSYLDHETQNVDTNTRYSLAFNTWIKGPLILDEITKETIYR